jgi:hypothetical protein
MIPSPKAFSKVVLFDKCRYRRRAWIEIILRSWCTPKYDQQLSVADPARDLKAGFKGA